MQCTGKRGSLGFKGKSLRERIIYHLSRQETRAFLSKEIERQGLINGEGEPMLFTFFLGSLNALSEYKLEDREIMDRIGGEVENQPN